MRFVIVEPGTTGKSELESRALSSVQLKGRFVMFLSRFCEKSAMLDVVVSGVL